MNAAAHPAALISSKPRVTLRAIAHRIGCSKNTVSLALRNDPQLPEHTRERIRKVAREMGYQPNAVFSHLMTQLRLSQSVRFQSKLALVNAHASRDAFRHHPTVPTYVQGCQDRAAALGYSFDPFWLYDPDATASRWIRIFTTRGIKGIIVVGLMAQNRLPDQLRDVWEQFPTVVTGVRTTAPSLPYACVDHYNLTQAAFEKALALGYRRPALVIDEAIDRLVEHRFSASMSAGQRLLPEVDRVPAFIERHCEMGTAMAFNQWFDRHRPDVIFTLYNDVVHWLEERSIRAPRDVGIIQLEWRASHPHIAGMNQHNESTGAAAVDLLVDQIRHNEKGIPDFPRATLIGASWMDGASVMCQREREALSVLRTA